jgi:hypothetical protein
MSMYDGCKRVNTGTCTIKAGTKKQICIGKACDYANFITAEDQTRDVMALVDPRRRIESVSVRFDAFCTETYYLNQLWVPGAYASSPNHKFFEIGERPEEQSIGVPYSFQVWGFLQNLDDFVPSHELSPTTNYFYYVSEYEKAHGIDPWHTTPFTLVPDLLLKECSGYTHKRDDDDGFCYMCMNTGHVLDMKEVI